MFYSERKEYSCGGPGTQIILLGLQGPGSHMTPPYKSGTDHIGIIRRRRATYTCIQYTYTFYTESLDLSTWNGIYGSQYYYAAYNSKALLKQNRREPCVSETFTDT